MNSSDSLWQQIIEPIEDRMIRSVWRITRNAQDAEDAMQNALMAIWKRQHRISKHPSPQALILKMCIDAACDVARRRGRDRRKIEPHDPRDLLVDGAPLPWEEIAQRELSSEIVAAITRLSRCQAVAITLRVFPVDYVMRPEFVCRPPMGIGNPHQEPALDLHPADGPPGCILLTVTHTTKAGRVNEKGIGLADINRFWLDPQRDYIALRWEMVTRTGTGEEIISSQRIVEETARSPQGVWYATRVRLKNAVRPENGKEHDQIYNIYVDFDAELPDALFEVPTPGRIE